MNTTVKIIILCYILLYSSSLLSQDKVPGVVVAYSPASSGIYLGSPSIVKFQNGDYIASFDYFGSGYKDTVQIVPIFKSTDKGHTWEKICDLKKMFWGKLFFHNKNLYMIGVDKPAGRLSIRKSTDEGKTWTDAYNGKTGILASDNGYHTAPMPVIIHDGKLWKAAEYNDTLTSSGWLKKNYSFVISAPIDANLLDAENWTFSNRKLPPDYHPDFPWLEGNTAVAPNGNIAVVNRKHNVNDDTASYYEVSKDGKNIIENSIKYIRLPGACKKFTIHYDVKSKLYWSLTNHSPKKYRGINHVERTRSTVALIYSKDLLNWKIKAILLSHPDVKYSGFQYIDWFIEGNDIAALSRTAFWDGVEKANDCHNANYITFHRFKNFRNAKTPAKWKDLED